jgi:hypothetical protein
MANAGKRSKPSVPAGAKPPSDNAAPPLRDDDVFKNEGLRGLVVRAGVGALPAVWED